MIVLGGIGGPAPSVAACAALLDQPGTLLAPEMAGMTARDMPGDRQLTLKRVPGPVYPSFHVRFVGHWGAANMLPGGGDR
jgi:hypothetical protein